MFNQVLRKTDSHKMVYSTSPGFRILFVLTAAIFISYIAVFGEGSFLERINVAVLIITVICLFAALYLERWIFDKTTNRFERNVGIVFLHTRRRRSLDALQKAVLEEPGVKYEDRRMMRWMSRRAATLSVVDQDGTVFRLEMVRGGSVRVLKKSAEQLSDFCGIPLEDHLGDIDGEELYRRS